MHCNSKPKDSMPMRSLTPPRAACLLFATSCAIGPGIALAQTAATPAQIERVMVTGESPGPGLWKVSRGDHVLWIAGTHAPVPKKLTWKSTRIEDVVKGAQEVISAPAFTVSSSQLGWWTTLTLLPTALGVPYNPGDKLLKDVVPPALYARWEVQRDKHLLGYNDTSNEVDRWRPWFAAAKLYRSALDKAEMTAVNPMWGRITDVAKQAKVKITEAKYEPKLQNARAAVKEFSSKPLDDLACFEKTLARLETDLDAMRLRANAWARGNVDQIRKLPEADHTLACNAAFFNSPIVKSVGPVDLRREMDLAWMKEVERALAANRVTVAVLPVTQLVAPGGYLAMLKERGYLVEEPE